MELRVELQKGGLEAVAFVEGAGPDLDVDSAASSALEQLRAMGVHGDLELAQIKKSILARNGSDTATQGIVIARAQPPRSGVDAQIVPFFPIRETPMHPGGDPAALYARNVIYPGDTVLQKTPASPGIPGKSLTGTPLPAPQGADIPVVAGHGVRVDDDGTTYRSQTYGVVLFYRGQLQVWEALSVSEDRMQATLTVLPDPKLDEAEHVQKLKQTLSTLEVTHGIDESALVEAVRRVRESEKLAAEVVVARGREPQDGRETDYKLLIDSDKKVGKLLDGDRIDFRESETVKNVRSGDPLAEVIPGVEPLPGIRVDGTTLRAKLARATGLKPGQNTVPSEDGLRILADADGMVLIKEGRFHIADEYLVQGDVDYHTGNIRGSGSVHVRGNVKPGFAVQAAHSVTIDGDVEEAVVESGGQATIRGGVTAGSRVKAEGNLEAKYTLNSKVESGGDVEIRLSATNSQIYAKGKVRAVGSQGAVLGGELNAALGLEARTVGSPSSKTHVAVGVDLRVVREMERIEREQAEGREEMQKLQSSLGKEFLKDPRAAIAAIPPALRRPKLALLQRMQELYKRETELKGRREELNQLNLEMKNAQIVVHGEIHAGTTVTVGSSTVTLTEDLRRIVLYYNTETHRIASRRL